MDLRMWPPHAIFSVLVCMTYVHASEQSGAVCGGRLAGPHGVIRTPHFPAAFPVPLRCTWIISHEIENGTISVYFTQQYVTSGLTFTEYTYYDETRRVDERRAFTVTEENITRVKFLQVTSPVLVVELRVAALEGSQLRALGLLAVFGLNMTYAVRPPPPRRGTAPAAPDAAPDSCSALECRLLGDCKVTSDYQKFYCDCFPGYSGADCGEGPLCARAENRCNHGGVCRQMGPAAVSCVCAPGYTGVFCESHIGPPECGLEECSVDCDDKAACDCNPRDSDITSARFETTLLVTGTGQGSANVSRETKNELTTYLEASNITLEDEIQIIDVSEPRSADGSRAVHARIWGPRRAAGALRAALVRLASRTRTHGGLRPLAPAHFEMQPALSVHALTINQRSEVWEGSEFILSCTAYGSPGIRFAWYKDGVKINFNGTARDLWTRTVTEDALGRRISVLGVSSARAQDGGRWSCAADDAGRRRCRALHLTVLRPPGVRLLPSTITVNKGDNVSITCLTDAIQAHGALGFSWTRERSLLPLVPGREVWEDLYPAGSVLKLFNVQKSGQYRCQVSSVAGTKAKAVQLWALAETEAACESSAACGMRWPRTAPGAHATAACPHGHSGETTRFCDPMAGQRGVKWQVPDFSGCIADSLKSIYARFIRISYGYSWEDVASVCQEYGGVLRSLPLHPGAGTIPLQHTLEIIQYLQSTAASTKDRLESVPYLFRIIDILLKHPDAFLDEEDTYQLQNALIQTASFKYDLDEHFQEFSVISKPVREDNAAHFRLRPKLTGDEEWLVDSAGVELIERSGNASVVAAQYNNLASRLPSLRTSMEYKDTREVEYLLTSQQVQFSVSGTGVDATLQHSVTIVFTHVLNYSAIANKLACGIRSLSEPRTWSTKACELRIRESRFVACRCRGLGTYALFSVARSSLTDAEKDLRGVVKITVGVGGALCMVAAVLQLLGLFPSKSVKMPIILKSATAVANSAALFTLLECDTRQEEACSGALGWVCAACWCCGCAALCAQPLLLQGELAGRTSHASSVGLIAGVCILTWLSARLWGGAPLQLGSAAQMVCTAGCALLIILCFGLAVCAALRIKTITNKVPTERRTYLKDRLRIIRHTLLLLLTTAASQAAGLAYVQPDSRETSRVIVLATAAIVNGITMVVCYVIRDEECIRAVYRALSISPPQRHWEHDPTGDASLSLYIKQSCEVESRGGVVTLESSSSQMSPITSYWRASGLESPARINRRMSTPDTRADIVRCVEYADCVPRRHELDACDVNTHVLCDLVSPCTPRSCATPLVSLKPPGCVLCARSTPDVSVPMKSCLKKTTNEFASSTSLPPMEVDSKAHIEHVNREWNKAYHSSVSPDAEKVLNKISNDLDFLLNRSQNSQEASENVLDRIEEAPT